MNIDNPYILGYATAESGYKVDGGLATEYLRADGSRGTVTGGGGIALTDLSATSPILYNNTTGVFSHTTNGAQGSVNGSGRTYIQDITLDSFGHITGIATATETVVNTDTNTWRPVSSLQEITNVGNSTTTSITAASFFEGSLRKLKKNILPFDKSGLDIINSLDIVTYDMKKGGITDKIGIIIDESPKDVANKEQNAVDLYKTIFVQAKAIQELSSKVDKLTELIEKLMKNG